MTLKENNTKKFPLELIKVYRYLLSIWNIKSETYSDRNKKKDAYATLLHNFKEHYQEGTQEDLKKKLNSLRTSFWKELVILTFKANPSGNAAILSIAALGAKLKIWWEVWARRANVKLLNNLTQNLSVYGLIKLLLNAA